MENKKESVENTQEKRTVDKIYEEIEKKNREYEKRMELIEAILKV